MSARIDIAFDTAPAAHSAKNMHAGAGSLTSQQTAGRTPMVETPVRYGERARVFIGAYAPRFVGTDAQGRLTLDMAELDAVVGELIAASVAHELRAEAASLGREAAECARVADSLTGGER